MKLIIRVWRVARRTECRKEDILVRATRECTAGLARILFTSMRYISRWHQGIRRSEVFFLFAMSHFQLAKASAASGP